MVAHVASRWTQYPKYSVLGALPLLCLVLRRAIVYKKSGCYGCNGCYSYFCNSLTCAYVIVRKL
jgi:hypothetical protein